MRPLFLSILSASIVTVVPAVEHSAQATVFKNYKNESKCLGVSGGNMTPGTKLILWNCNGAPDQNWNFIPYANGAFPQFPLSGSEYEQMWTGGASSPTGAPDDYSSRCIALGNGLVFPKLANVIIWNCNAETTDQGWSAEYAGNDANGHQCYWLNNQKGDAIPPGYTFAGVSTLSLADGFTSNGTAVVLNGVDSQNRPDQKWCAY